MKNVDKSKLIVVHFKKHFSPIMNEDGKICEILGERAGIRTQDLLVKSQLL